MQRSILATFLAVAVSAAVVRDSRAGDVSAPASSASAGKPWLVINEDNDHFFKCDSSLMTEKGLTDYIDYIARGKVTHIFFCVNGQRTSYDSKTWEPIWAGLDEQARADTATAPDGTRDRWAVNCKKLFDAGIDPYSVWIARCREKGVGAWISMRMNDVHWCQNPRYFRNTSWYKKNVRFRRDPSGKNEDSFMNELDFAHKEVRDYTMAQIREIAVRWPSDGVELDWMRFGHAFRPGEERKNAPILDAFMREASAAIRAAGRKVAVRMPHTPSECLARGFNVDVWAKEGLVDVITAAPFIDSVPDIPVKEWLALVAGTRARLLTDLGCEIRGAPKAELAERYSDLAKKFLSLGAHGVCLFNLPYKSNAKYSTDSRGKAWYEEKDIAAEIYSRGCPFDGGADAECALPGEDGRKAAIPAWPFPDRMSAYVWRNWGLVDAATLADTVGAGVEDIRAVAQQMGLEPRPAVLPEWKRKGYITLVRRNWHLLPYEQILPLIGMTRQEFRFALLEDDFLWVKLGNVKPYCERLEWRACMLEEGRAARERIAAVLREEGLSPRAEEEPRFSFVRGISSVDPAFKRPANDDSPYDFRLIFSYFADFADPLSDPEIGSFPEGLLQKLAAEGVNAVWLHTVLRTLAKDPKYPEFGEGSERRIANLRKLVARCAKYGIRVFLYMNEPRAMPEDFFKADPSRAGFKGTSWGVQHAMCTSHPEVLRWLRDSLTQVFAGVPGLGGIFTITMSENLTNCASRMNRKPCPRCRDREVGDIVAEVNRAMIEGMVRGNPAAEALVWDWAWPREETERIVSSLPAKNCRLMAVSENGIPICRGGVKEKEADYSISIVGPGENARRLWKLARARGIPVVAKVQAANSWELSSFPYLPVMDLVAAHAANVMKEGVNGVMLSWSLGCYPSPNLSVYRDIRSGETDGEGVLNRLAARLYGEGKVAQARKAWKAFSDGFVNYPFSCRTIYVGPQQWGPANPLYAVKTGYSATMVGIPYDDLDGWRNLYPRETYVSLIGKVADGFAEGCRLMEGVAQKRELDMFRAQQMHFASCRDQALFVMARDAGDRAGMCRYARVELERAKAYWPIVRADSRIGYESSNQYFFLPRDVLEKVLSCRAVLDGAGSGPQGD